MIWNDMAGGVFHLGLSEYDLYDRFRQPLTVFGEKLWSTGERAEYGEFSLLADRVDRDAFWSARSENKVYAENTGLEPVYEINIEIRLDEDASDAQVIAESDSAYGEWAFYAAEPETGLVGFSAEGRTYTWDYELPRDEWTELTVVGEVGQTTLYVNGASVGTLGSQEPFEEYATLVFPMQRIGEETGAFQGEVSVEWEK